MLKDAEVELKPYSIETFLRKYSEHNPDISHLITDHPEHQGTETYGFNEWVILSRLGFTLRIRI
jgi:hypothetical protein